MEQLQKDNGTCETISKALLSAPSEGRNGWRILSRRITWFTLHFDNIALAAVFRSEVR